MRRAFPIIAALLLAALWAFGSLLHWAPGYLQRTAEQLISERLGMPARIGSVRLDVRQLAVELTELHVGTDTGSPQLRVARIRADADVAGLARTRLLESLTVEAPELTITQRTDRSFDLQELIARLSAPAAPQATGDGGGGFALAGLALERGRVRLIHAETGTVREITDIRISVPSISTDPDHRDRPVVLASSARADGHPVRVAGTALPFAAPPSAALELDVSVIRLARWQPFFDQPLPGGRVEGTLSGRAAIDARASSPPAVRLEADLALDAGTVSDSTGAVLAAITGLELRGLTLDSGRRELGVESVRVRRPRLAIGRDAQGRLDWQSLLAPAPGQASPAPAAGGPASAAVAASDPDRADAGGDASHAPWTWQVDRFQLGEGRIDFVDAAVRPAVPATVWNLQVTAEDIGSRADAVGRFQVRAGGTAALRAAGTLRGLRTLALEAGLTGLALAPLEPYASAYWSGRLAGGSAGAQVALAADLSDPLGTLKVTDASAVIDDLAIAYGRIDGSSDARPTGAADGPPPGGAPPGADSSGDARASAAGAPPAPALPAAPIRSPRITVAGVRVDLAARSALVGAVQINAPAVRLRREADGSLDLARLAARPIDRAAGDPTKPQADGQVADGSADANASTRANPWRWEVGRIGIGGGRVDFTDAAVSPAVPLVIEDLKLGVEALGNAPDASARFEVRAGGTAAIAASGTLRGLRKLALEAGLRGLALSTLEPYASAYWSGRLASGSAEARVALAVDLSDPLATLKVGDASAEIRDLAIAYRDSVMPGGGGTGDAVLAPAAAAIGPPISSPRLAVSGVRVDLAARSLAVGAIELDRPAVAMRREADGRLDLARLAAAGAAGSETGRETGRETGSRADAAAGADHAAASGPWRW
ncbi:MAG: DUF748 domain-containing protein, partial [Burkholderiales bacterium]